MCCVITTFLTLIILILTTPVFSRNQNKLKCNLNVTVDITSGVKNSTTHEIIHNNVTYKENDYFKNETNIDQILGCLCNVEICVRKCCPIGKTYNTDIFDCEDSDHELAHNFQISVHNKSEKIKVDKNRIKYVTGQCTNNPYALDPENIESDAYYLQHNGLLYFPKSVKAINTYRNQESFCLDLDSAANHTFISIVCDDGLVDEQIRQNSIGMIISMPFLMVTFFVYACVPELQNIHGKCLMCYVSTLFTAYIFLVSVQLENNIKDAFCVVAPFIIYFAFMVSFMWLNVMSIDIWWTFSGRRGFRDSGRHSERTRFLVYSIYAWGIPVIMLSIAIGLQFASNLPSYILSPKFGEEKCWFSNDKSMGYYFYGPILVIILANLTLFAYTSIKIYRVQRDTDQSMRHESQRHGSDNEMKQSFKGTPMVYLLELCNEKDITYKLYLKLMLVFGVNWLMEIVSWLVSGPQWLWYVTDMCNALYGVFIFFIFVCKANVWKLCRKRYHVFMGRPYLATTYAPTSSTRSTAVSQSTAHAPGNGVDADSYALTSSTAA